MSKKHEGQSYNYKTHTRKHRSFQDLRLHSGFLYMNKSTNIKGEKIDKFNLIKNLKCLSFKGSHQESETTTEWEKCANHLSDKTLVFKIMMNSYNKTRKRKSN